MNTYTIPNHQAIKISAAGSYLIGRYTDERLNIARDPAFKIAEEFKHLARTTDIIATPQQNQKKNILFQTKSQKQTETFLKTKTFLGHDIEFPSTEA